MYPLFPSHSGTWNNEETLLGIMANIVLMPNVSEALFEHLLLTCQRNMSTLVEENIILNCNSVWKSRRYGFILKLSETGPIFTTG